MSHRQKYWLLAASISTVLIISASIAGLLTGHAADVVLIWFGFTYIGSLIAGPFLLFVVYDLYRSMQQDEQDPC